MGVDTSQLALGQRSHFIELNMEDTPAKLLQERYGTASEFEFDALWNSSLSAMLSHRSVRSCLDKPLPTGTLELLVFAPQLLI